MRRHLVLVLVAFLCPLAAAQNQAPERPSGWTDKPPVTAKHWMIAAANPLAVEAGYRILKRGGSAVDAAIAVQLVLGLTEPQSSGLGGGAFMLLHDAKAKKLIAYDGRETAPAAAKPDRFMKDGEPISFYGAVIGGKAVGVPRNRTLAGNHAPETRTIEVVRTVCAGHRTRRAGLCRITTPSCVDCRGRISHAAARKSVLLRR